MTIKFLRVFTPFAAGYFLSYAFRTVNAVISPELTRELSLSPSALGLLTSAYFIAFGAAQIPAGMLLDRFGPRRVEPAFLLLTGTGALAFAWSESETGLLVARALIGMGVATCLMAPLKGIATWYPAQRHGSLAGWMMVAGGLGALATTAPLELALRFVPWRSIFVFFAGVTYSVALVLWWRVPDTPRPDQTSSLAAQWAGVRLVFGSRRFWWIAPLGGLGMGAFMAIQGLWSVPWLIEVEGYSRALAARHLLVMGVVTLGGYVFLGSCSTRLAHRGVHARHLFAWGFGLNLLALFAIVGRVPGSYFWWGAYGLGAAVNVLGFTILGDGFPRELSGRASTALNLLMFSGSFVAQWGIGLMVELADKAFGLDTGGGLRSAFTVVLVLETITYSWFVLQWKQHAGPGHATARVGA